MAIFSSQIYDFQLMIHLEFEVLESRWRVIKALPTEGVLRDPTCKQGIKKLLRVVSVASKNIQICIEICGKRIQVLKFHISLHRQLNYNLSKEDEGLWTFSVSLISFFCDWFSWVFLLLTLNMGLSSVGRSSNFKETKQSLPKQNILIIKIARAYLREFLFLRTIPWSRSSLKSLSARHVARSWAEVFIASDLKSSLILLMTFRSLSLSAVNIFSIHDLNRSIFLVIVLSWK